MAPQFTWHVFPVAGSYVQHDRLRKKLLTEALPATMSAIYAGRARDAYAGSTTPRLEDRPTTLARPGGSVCSSYHGGMSATGTGLFNPNPPFLSSDQHRAAQQEVTPRSRASSFAGVSASRRNVNGCPARQTAAYVAQGAFRRRLRSLFTRKTLEAESHYVGLLRGHWR